MSYQGADGLYTVFPTAGSGRSGSRGSSAGKPCKYGPRGSDGYCPPKPKAAKRPSSARRGRARAAMKPPKTLTYPRITTKNPLRAPTTTETVVGAVGGRGLLRKLAPVARQLGKSAFPRTAAGVAGAIGEVGAIPLAAAGLASYYLARFGLSKLALKKATMRENAARAADAYRALRVRLEQDQGRPLTLTQLKRTATLFKNELLKLGLSSSDLSRVMGRSAYDPTPT